MMTTLASAPDTDFRANQATATRAAIAALSPIEGLGPLISRTHASESPEIRGLASSKIQTHPDLAAGLAGLLHNEWWNEALLFLRQHDVPPTPELVVALRGAFEQLAWRAAEEIRTARVLFDDSFDADARTILALAEKYSDPAADFVPAIREFRDAVQTPRRQKIRPNCLPMLNEWLRAHRGG